MDGMDGMDSKRVDRSLFFAGNGGGGMWVDAVWSAAVTDDATGEVLAMATNPEDGGRWAMVGVRLNREMLATLRALAGMDGPLPGETERAEAAYWRECAEYAMQILARGRSAGGDWASAALRAESYLRQTLATETPAPDGSRGKVPVANGQWMGEIERRLDRLDRLATEAGDYVMPLAAKAAERLDEIEKGLAELEKLSLASRVAYLERQTQGVNGPDAGL